MATLSVLKFNSPEGADRALEILRRLQEQHIIRLADAAVVTWPSDSRAPRTKQSFDPTGAGLAGGAFWGFLFGLIFFVPLLGLALGAASGAIAGALADYGINDDFIRRTREKVTPGTSALFLLAQTDAADRVAGELRSLNPELLTTNLSGEQENQLRQLFAQA